MKIHEPKNSEKYIFNSIATHPLQAWEWGEFREKTGVKVIRRIFLKNKKAVHAFQLTIHKIPLTSYTVGYIPKGLMPTREIIEELMKIGREERCIFVKLEPTVTTNTSEESSSNTSEVAEWTPRRWTVPDELRVSSHPLFTKYTFQLDLTKSDDELLKNMHPKTRYNIRVAQRHGVTVEEDNSYKAFEIYIKLMHETTKRQRYYAHTEEYHRAMWKVLRAQSIKRKAQNELSAHLLVARYKGITLVTWIVFIFNDIIYYPYGASSSEHKEAMASNLMMWEAIRFGKRMGCKVFDMWGSLGPAPDPKDPWYGFHRFKEGYGGKLVEFVGSYDLVLKPFWYNLFVISDKLRWLYLKARRF